MRDFRTIILAAGKGTRMRSQRAKVLHEVCGKALIDHVVEIVGRVGSQRTYVVLGHQIEQARQHLRPEIGIVHQKNLLGTADAVRSARGEFKNYRGHVLVLCGDTVLLRQGTIKSLVQQHSRRKAFCTFLSAEVGDPSGYGRVIRDAGGRAVAIREEKDATPEEKAIREINVGVYCFQSAALFKFIDAVKLNEKKKEFYLTDLVSLFSERGLVVDTVATDDASEGLGINTREDLAYAEQVLRKRTLKDLMAGGVTIVDPDNTHIHSSVKIGQDTIIRPFTVIEQDVQIGSGCVIGPFARLRPGTRLGNNVEIGNFAEVSRSKLGTGCMQKHFSFLGDAEVGVGSNIGAGTVTANYDGKNKNKTRIGKRAFIGSDSILVAPVTIGDEAVTGAGCVVTRGTVVPHRAIAVGVPARIIKKSR